MTSRTLCWQALWSERAPGLGLEHLQLDDGCADGIVLAIDDDTGPYRLHYQLRWDETWQLREAELTVMQDGTERSLVLHAGSDGRWHDGTGNELALLQGCIDIDIWPTPFTNSFPIRRAPLAIGERRQGRMAWIAAPALTVQAQNQAYTRLAERRYRFQSLDDSGFEADLEVDADGLVIDYPGLFRRIETPG